MQHVLLKVWIRRETDEKGKTKEGTNRFSEEHTEDAFFHTWGKEAIEYEDGIAEQSVAIIERSNGVIDLVPPHTVKFTRKLVTEA